MPSEWWVHDHLVEPARAVLRGVPVGGEVGDPDSLPAELLIGIEGTFRAEVAHRYAPWPPESTTDGLIAHLCTRRAPATLEFVGMGFINFAGERFPLKVLIELSEDLDHLERFVCEIGEANPDGSPPRLPESSMILVVRDDDGTSAQPHVLVGRRERGIQWTRAFVLTGDDLD